MFNITNMRGKVAKFCIFKTVYRLGEDIIGTFNFSEGDIPCLQVSLQSVSFSFFYHIFCLIGLWIIIFHVAVFMFQYSISLQSEEEIQQQYQRRPGQPISVTGHGRHLESCLHTASSHFSLPIPLNVTPGFSTDIGQSPVRSCVQCAHLNHPAGFYGFCYFYRKSILRRGYTLWREWSSGAMFLRPAPSFVCFFLQTHKWRDVHSWHFDAVSAAGRNGEKQIGWNIQTTDF